MRRVGACYCAAVADYCGLARSRRVSRLALQLASLLHDFAIAVLATRSGLVLAR